MLPPCGSGPYDPAAFLEGGFNTAAIHPPRAVGVRATATACAVYEWSNATPPPTVRTRPSPSTPKVGAHGDGPGGTHGRAAAAGGAGMCTEMKRGPAMRPSTLASAGSKLLTLYEPSIPPSARRVPVSTTGLYVYDCWYV